MNNFIDFFSLRTENNTYNSASENKTIYTYMVKHKSLAFAFLLLHLIGFQLLGSLIQVIMKDYMGINDTLTLGIYATFIADGILCLIYLLVTLAVPELRKTILKSRYATFALLGIFTLVIFIFNNIGSNIIGIIISNFTTESNNNQNAIVKMLEAEPAIMIFTTVILAPIAEEYAYRFGLVSLFGQKKKAVAIIVSGLLFALIHFDYTTIMTAEFVNEILNIFSYLFAGLIFAYAYIRSESGLPSIAAHFANNLIATLSILLV